MPTNQTSPLKVFEYRGDLNEFLCYYNYLPNLTRRLDQISNLSFNQALINEIVLWKLNRYVLIESNIFEELDKIKTINSGEHRSAEPTLKRLLETRGVDLPMASTFLRFRNPRAFQLIDRHAYRAIYGRSYALYTSTSIPKKIKTYFEYLDELHNLCESKSLVFETVDRLLYIFDKRENGPLSTRSKRGT